MFIQIYYVSQNLKTREIEPAIFEFMSAEKIISDWKKKNFKPVYWLEGEEPYYIDEVIYYAENNILSEAEAGFNLTVFYGRDADWASVLNACMRYPMFADKQVVLLKEAQHMKEIDKLEHYISKPLASTIFVVAYKEKKVDARTKFAKVLKDKAEVFTSKKMYDDKLPEWTSNMIESQGFTINHGALMLLVDHIGNDLSRLRNEVDKLSLNLGDRKNITEDDIEKYIGISKEYNVFELQDAVIKKDLPKAIRIIQYFEANPKAATIHYVLPILYNFFSKLWVASSSGAVSESEMRSMFYAGALKQANNALKNFSSARIEEIIFLLHQYNLRSIGINSATSNDASLLKELMVKIII